MPVEYVFLATMVFFAAGLAFSFPDYFSDLLIRAGGNMDGHDEWSVPVGEGEGSDPTRTSTDPDDPGDGSEGTDDEPPTDLPPEDEDFGEDPWTSDETSGSGCNQGLGNGAEGCDPGNSNNNQDSNDEPGGGRGGKQYNIKY